MEVPSPGLTRARVHELPGIGGPGPPVHHGPSLAAWIFFLALLTAIVIAAAAGVARRRR